MAYGWHQAESFYSCPSPWKQTETAVDGLFKSLNYLLSMQKISLESLPGKGRSYKNRTRRTKAHCQDTVSFFTETTSSAFPQTSMVMLYWQMSHSQLREWCQPSGMYIWLVPRSVLKHPGGNLSRKGPKEGDIILVKYIMYLIYQLMKWGLWGSRLNLHICLPYELSKYYGKNWPKWLCALAIMLLCLHSEQWSCDAYIYIAPCAHISNHHIHGVMVKVAFRYGDS